MSLGGFAVLGALGAAGASSRKVLRRLRGQDEVRLGDAGVQLPAARAVATIRAMLARGRAAWSDLSRPRPTASPDTPAPRLSRKWLSPLQAASESAPSSGGRRGVAQSVGCGFLCGRVNQRSSWACMEPVKPAPVEVAIAA